MLPHILHPLLHDEPGASPEARSHERHMHGPPDHAHHRGPPPGHRGPRRVPVILPILTVAWGLLMVAIGALALRRWIARPLAELTRATEAFGAGKLQTRAHVARQDELGELARTFNQMTERIEHTVRSEKELLANISHELRTPLARIRVAMDLAHEGDSETTRGMLQEIESDVAELDSMLENVLTIRRLEAESGVASSAGFSMLPVPTTVVSLFDETVLRFRARFPARPLQVESALLEQDSVLMDRVLFRRALDNLLANAHQHSGTPNAPIVLRAARVGDDVHIEVADRGDGIAPSDLTNVFEPFFRADRSRTRATGGVGLGLTLTKQIVEAHRGTIRVHSELGKGTCFTISLPVTKVA